MRRQSVEDPEGGDHWIAYSDLLVSLLMVFVLLLFLALANWRESIVIVAGSLGEIAEAVGGEGQHLPEGVRYDQERGTIVMDSEVLFPYGSATLQPQAAVTIRAVATSVIPQLLARPAVDTVLAEIVVEGHTDTVGTYMYNLQLSQARAYSVMREMVESTYGEWYAERLRQLIVASGKSEVHPVLNADGTVNPPRSRRIEIRFRPRTEKLLTQILEQLGPDAGVRK